MKRIIWAAILSGLMVWIVNWMVNDSKQTEKQNIFYNAGQVVALGQCRENECSYQYKDKDGQLKYGSSEKPVSLGQLVYQQCWYEIKRGDRCYVNYKPTTD